MQITMKDRVAVVTGGSKGIGIAVARRFAESGAKVAILARGADDLKAAREQLAKDGLQVHDYVCDVSKASDISATYDKIVKDLGRIDILVNNAGTSRAMPFEAVTDAIWQEDLDLKLFAAIRLSRLVWPGMKAAQMGPHHQCAQHRRQGAGGRLDADLRLARGRHGADQGDGERRRRAQHPRQCDAGRPDRQRSMGEAARQEAPETDFDAFTRDLAKGVPMGRMGTAEEFANLACFLASDQGSYITGTAINVDGGRSPVV